MFSTTYTVAFTKLVYYYILRSSKKNYFTGCLDPNANI